MKIYVIYKFVVIHILGKNYESFKSEKINVHSAVWVKISQLVTV
jgi:hypothetical protein